MLISLAGATMSVVGIVGLVSHWGSTAASAPIPTTTTAPTTTTSLVAYPAPLAQESITFFDAFLAAIRGGNARFLAAHLDPAVTKRYGESQCARVVGRLKDPSVNLQLKRFWGPHDYAYTSDGMTAQIANTYVFRATGSVGGTRGSHDFHFAFDSRGFHLFLDCGTPLQTH